MVKKRKLHRKKEIKKTIEIYERVLKDDRVLEDVEHEEMTKKQFLKYIRTIRKDKDSSLGDYSWEDGFIYVKIIYSW